MSANEHDDHMPDSDDVIERLGTENERLRALLREALEYLVAYEPPAGYALRVLIAKELE